MFEPLLIELLGSHTQGFSSLLSVCTPCPFNYYSLVNTSTQPCIPVCSCFSPLPGRPVSMGCLMGVSRGFALCSVPQMGTAVLAVLLLFPATFGPSLTIPLDQWKTFAVLSTTVSGAQKLLFQWNRRRGRRGYWLPMWWRCPCLFLFLTMCMYSFTEDRGMRLGLRMRV